MMNDNNLINWEEIKNYPEVRDYIWNKYMEDSYFRQEVDMHRANNVYFNFLFKKLFKDKNITRS